MLSRFAPRRMQDAVVRLPISRLVGSRRRPSPGSDGRLQRPSAGHDPRPSFSIATSRLHMNRILAALWLLCLSTGALASSFDITSLQLLNQSEFRQLAQDLGAAFSYKPLEPADPLGITGFDLGVALTGTTLANTASIQKAITNGSVYSTLPQPSVRAVKGLPYNVDVGVMYARVPDSGGLNIYGGELKWAVLPGNTAVPAVALRAAVTRMDGVSQLGFESISADVSVSKGFLLATPYAGVGEVWSRSSTDGLSLQQENLTQGKLFGGVNVNFGLANVDVEADSTGGIHSYSVKLGFRF